VTAVPPIRGTTLVAAIAGVIAAATIVTHTHTGKDAASSYSYGQAVQGLAGC